MEVPYVPTSAETVTEEWMKKVLAREFGVSPAESKQAIKVTRLDVSAGALKTDGFLSRMQRILVTARLDPTHGDGPEKDTQDEEKSFHLIAKLYPPGEIHQKMVRNLRVFEREIHVYTTFQDLVTKHQPDPSKIRMSIPKCYFSETGMDASCIVMEDLKHAGFRLNDKRVGWTLEHAKVSIVAEATYAALGINAKNRMGVEAYLLANAPITPEPFNDQFGILMDYQFFPGMITFAKGQNRLDLVERLEAYQKPGSVFARLMASVHRLGPMATFTHGDCWNNNYMFRYEKDDQGNEVPVEVKILDLQISRYCLPTADLAYMLCANMEGSLLETHLDTLLKLYYETMASILDSLRTPDWSRDTYSFEHFLKDMDGSWENGFLMAIWVVPWILTDESDLLDMDALKDAEDMQNTEFYDEHRERMAKGINEGATRRLTQIMEFAVKRGII